MNPSLPPAFSIAVFRGPVLAGLLGAGVFFVGGVGGGLPSAKAAPTEATAPKVSNDTKAAAAKAPLSPPPDFSYILTRWQPERDFKRIGEYFSGREDTGGDVIVRSDASNRSGMYFRVGLPLGKTFPPGSVLLVEYIRGDRPGVRTRSFELSSLTRWPFAELRVGLTGADWPGKPENPKEQDEKLGLIAWQLTLKDTAGAILFQRHSFLWELPPSPVPAAKEPDNATQAETPKP